MARCLLPQPINLPTFPHMCCAAGPCSWECTIRHTLPWDWVQAWLSKDSPKAAFMAAVMAKSVAYEQQRDPPAPGWIACDPLAFAVAVCEEVLLAAEPQHCAVELQVGGRPVQGRRTLGTAQACMQQRQAGWLAGWFQHGPRPLLLPVPAAECGDPRHERAAGAWRPCGAARQRAAGQGGVHGAV